MRTIWKFELNPLLYDQDVYMPAGAIVLDVQLQAEQVVAWAVVETDAELEPVTFHLRDTGGSMGNIRCRHVATVQLTPDYVRHIFMEER